MINTLRSLIALLTLAMIYSCANTVTLPENKPTQDKTYSFKWNNPEILKKSSYNWKTIPESLRKNHLQYTEWLVQEIKASGLDRLTPSDGKEFGLLSTSDAVEFWGNILVEVSFWESGWDTKNAYTESFGDSRGVNVVSRGLFQISVESGNNRKRSDCRLTDYKQLHDAHINIWCSARIIAYFVRTDGVISKKTVTGWKGPARYFSVLRGTRDYTAKALGAIKNANN